MAGDPESVRGPWVLKGANPEGLGVLRGSKPGTLGPPGPASHLRRSRDAGRSSRSRRPLQHVSGVSRWAAPGGGRSAGRGLRAHPGGSRADATPPSAATPTVAGCGAASKPSPARPPPPREGSAGIPTAPPRPEAPPREGAEPGLALRPAPAGHAPRTLPCEESSRNPTRIRVPPASEPHLRRRRAAHP